jgi:hypothetical protein
MKKGYFLFFLLPHTLSIIFGILTKEEILRNYVKLKRYPCRLCYPGYFILTNSELIFLFSCFMSKVNGDKGSINMH